MTRSGLIVERHRREVVIEAEGGERRAGLVSGRKLMPLTGDEIAWHLSDDGTAIVDQLLPRRSLLERIDNRGRPEGVAANVSLLVIVLAPVPAPDWQLLDHYLVGAECGRIAAAIVRNKCDLADAAMDARLDLYGRLEYPLLAVSARSTVGIAELGRILYGHRSVFVGQSGVGKSSLLNALLRVDAQTVGQLSQRRALGRHTTTSSVLHRLPAGGDIIDSPGVRRYAPFVDDPTGLDHAFVEFRPHLGNCRFSDCRHRSEPGCAVRAALDRGTIAAERYASYLALKATLEQLNCG
jgi:ribosome biogenesis GTPase